MSFETLRKSAKRWLKTIRSGDAAALAKLRELLPQASPTPGLREVQQALARERMYPRCPIYRAAGGDDMTAGCKTPMQRRTNAAGYGSGCSAVSLGLANAWGKSSAARAWGQPAARRSKSSVKYTKGLTLLRAQLRASVSRAASGARRRASRWPTSFS